MKKVILGEGVKVNYLIYLGDVEVGVKVNIGVGIIICNYDGVNKFKIVIGDNVFIGLNLLFVVFVNIGKGVIVGVGFVIMLIVDEDVLVVVCGK